VPIALFTAIGAAAAAGLHHAHTHAGSRRSRHGSVHGGVSPANIIIGYDGSVKVANLGVAPAADASYLAPEQASAAGGEIDRRTDVFALGIVLYELATARRLFKAPSDYLTKAAIAEPNIPAPSRFRRGLPRALENIILKALAPSPANRFKSAGELHDALEAFARSLGMRPSPGAIADYLKKLFGVRPLPWLPEAHTVQVQGAFEVHEDDEDDGQLGVAAPPDHVLRTLGVPEARELEATPGRGIKTPMSWTSQSAPVAPAPPWTRLRVGIVAGAALTSAIIAFLVVGTVVRGKGGGDSIAPAIAPPPPPPPASVERELAPPPAPPAAPSTEVLPVAPDAGAGSGSGSAKIPATPAAQRTKARRQPRR
jgi:serine/threonine-protein kinase